MAVKGWMGKCVRQISDEVGKERGFLSGVNEEKDG